jgi:hypothetical protein
MRLRTTAGPSARPSANATCGGVLMGSSTNVHHRTPARVRWPSTASRVNPLRSRIRQIKPTACDGPCRGGPSTRHGRRGCSCADGSRASSHGDGCSVGMCASRSPPCAAPSGGAEWYQDENPGMPKETRHTRPSLRLGRVPPARQRPHKRRHTRRTPGAARAAGRAAVQAW